MKQLQSALKLQKEQQSRNNGIYGHGKGKLNCEKWSLDPDLIEDCPGQGRQRIRQVISNVLKSKFENEKYLQEETFIDLIAELTAALPHLSSQLQKLTKIEEVLQDIGESYMGELKNYIKHFQSLLDAKIRKLKKKEKRSQLVQFQRLAQKQGMKRKSQVCYINEDEKESHYRTKQIGRIQQKQEHSSKRSFGTMNSGSNQNQSGSGKNKSGSQSKSGEGNALAVLLANVVRPEDKRIERSKQTQKYDFSSVLSASVTVRQRHNNTTKVSTIVQQSMKHQVQPNKQGESQDKDQAFIFHRPKRAKKGKF